VAQGIALASNEVHLWRVQCADIDEPELLGRYRALMSAAELQRQARYRFERDRHRDLIARALVRTSVSRYLGGEPGHWRFHPGEHGKPELIGAPLPLRFNLSHSKDLVVCAVALQHDVGVDVEYTERGNDVLAIARHYFSRREVEDLFALPAERQRDRFFDYWTLKEAYIKARGKGISLGLGNFSFDLTCSDEISIGFVPTLNDDAAAWQFRLYRPLPEYRMALAWRQGREPVVVRQYDVVPLQSSTER
jgi:4'-phosphopantetheinyl transferase